jgi:hypothetical protein
MITQKASQKLRQPRVRLVVCIENKGYPASLELRKIYPALVDRSAAAAGMLRVIDESGEDYLYPARYFAPVTVTAAARAALRLGPGRPDLRPTVKQKGLSCPH